jgi:hypothetical protein
MPTVIGCRQTGRNFVQLNNFDLRIRYLQGRIDRQTFEKTILFRDRKNVRRRFMADFYELLDQIMQDILQRLMRSGGVDLPSYREEMLAALKHYNKHAHQFESEFELKVPQFKFLNKSPYVKRLYISAIY